MNIQEYISSGILEQYVLNLVSKDERLEVERMAGLHPEIREELNEIENALNTFAQSNAMPMRSRLKEDILNKIDQLNTQSTSSIPSPKSTITSSNRNKWVLPLLGLIALMLGCLTLLFYLKQKSVRTQLTDNQEELKLVQNNCDTKLNALQDKIDLLRDPFLEVTKLRKSPDLSTSETPGNAIAAVYINSNEQKAYLDLQQLPEPPTGKQYQLWGIRIVNGELAPESMGIFDPNLEEGAFAEMDYLENIDLYALSLEDLGEQEIPDLTQVYVVAEVDKELI